MYLFPSPLHTQADLSPTDRHEDNLKWQWDKFHFVANCFFQLFFSFLFLRADLDQAVTLTGVPNPHKKYANCYLFFHLDLCQMHCNYKETFVSDLYERTWLFTFVIFLKKINPIWHVAINVQVQYRWQSILIFTKAGTVEKKKKLLKISNTYYLWPSTSHISIK